MNSRRQKDPDGTFIMAVDEKEKKVDPSSNKQRWQPQQGSSSQFKGPTHGYEDVTFDVSNSKKSHSAASTHDEKVDRLAGYIAINNSKYDGATAAHAVRTLKAPTFEDPKDIVDEAKATLRQKKDWERKYRKFEQGEENWDKNNKLIFALFWSHCTSSMQTKLKGNDDWNTIYEANDGLKLVTLIKKIVFDVDAAGQNMLQMVQADKALFTAHQTFNQSLESYLKDFTAQREIAEAVGSSPGMSKAATTLIGKAKSLTWAAISADAGKKKELTEEAAEEYYAPLLFDGLNKARFGELKRRIRNDFTTAGLDHVPKTVSKVLEVAQKCLADNPTPEAKGGGTPGVAFYASSSKGC